MQNKEQQQNLPVIDKGAPIQVTLQREAVNTDEIEIDLVRVFETMKRRRRLFAWVLVLCLAVGACAPLVMYQFTKPPLTVASVVTLTNASLDLNQITSSYVLQNALEGLALSQPVGAELLAANIGVQRVLTEGSAQQQEILKRMIENKSADAYQQVLQATPAYTNRFVVTLTNGFSPAGSRRKLYLADDELRQVLDRVLDAYNKYLVELYADTRMPLDEIGLIDPQETDLMESLDQLKLAMDDLYAYCNAKPENARAYRSWRTGRSLTDWMETLQTLRETCVDYLYAFVHTNSLARDVDALLTSYRFQLQEAQTQLDAVNGDIETLDRLVREYKNDEIFVTVLENDTTKSTTTNTDYYNEMILSQPANYERAARLETSIADIQDKISALEAATERDAAAQQDKIAQADAELDDVLSACHAAYEAITAHMEELVEQPVYTTFAEHTTAAGKTESFLTASMKKILTGLAAGAVVALGLWFLAGLAPEFTRRRKEDEAGARAGGEEAADR